MQTMDQMVDQENMHKIGLLSFKCGVSFFFLFAFEKRGMKECAEWTSFHAKFI